MHLTSTVLHVIIIVNQGVTTITWWGQCSEQGGDSMHDSMGYSDLRGNFDIFHDSMQVINDY